ncbi:hypothetical protein LDC_0307, partial [sediment metagenome]
MGQTLGSGVVLTEGQIPTLLIRGQGGSMEGVVRGKPIQRTEVNREYTASWAMDTSEGLTNTSPRKYAALSIDGKYQKTTLEPRVRTVAETSNQKDLNSQLLYIGGDASGNSLNGGIESWELYGRPAQVVRTAQADHVLTLDTTGVGYLANAAIPDMCDYTFGVPLANRWCWKTSEFSG